MDGSLLYLPFFLVGTFFLFLSLRMGNLIFNCRPSVTARTFYKYIEGSHLVPVHSCACELRLSRDIGEIINV